ncbi:hypothetical protein ACJX0J_028429 [Zea mays]
MCQCCGFLNMGSMEEYMNLCQWTRRMKSSCKAHVHNIKHDVDDDGIVPNEKLAQFDSTLKPSGVSDQGQKYFATWNIGKQMEESSSLCHNRKIPSAVSI